MTRPHLGARVRVTFAETVAYPAETVNGAVKRTYPDGIDVEVTETSESHDMFEVFTLFDSQLADGAATLEVLP